VNAASIGSLAYLITGGRCSATPPSSTPRACPRRQGLSYAYVNPVVAVLLGIVFLTNARGRRVRRMAASSLPSFCSPPPAVKTNGPDHSSEEYEPALAE